MRPPDSAASRPSIGPGFILGRIAGIELAIHPSWLVTFTILVVLTRSQVVLRLSPSASGLEGWLLAIGFGIAFFLSIVVHELCHSIAARSYGLEARRITLFLFGGVSQVGREPPSPAAEYTIAVVGPLASILLAGVFAVTARMLHPGHPGLPGAAGFLAVVNVFLAGFNLVPGFPLDGGRILRSALWAGLRDRARATRLASYGGKAVALSLIGLGAAFFVSNVATEVGEGLNGLWWALLGWFLYGAVGSAARTEGGARPASLLDPQPGSWRVARTAEDPRPTEETSVRAEGPADTLEPDEGHPPKPQARRGGRRSAPRPRAARAAAHKPGNRARHPQRRAPAQGRAARPRRRA